MQKCIRDLRALKNALEEYERESPGYGWELLRERGMEELSCPALQSAIEKANNELDMLAGKDADGADFRCDLSDYVNEDLLNTIGNASFNEFVSNVMTGLGILGTFMGLAHGLKSFNTASAEAIESSIMPLIDGIKVAFYTSIFGVIFSIVYGALYRGSMKQAQDALNEFLDTYYKSLGLRPENDVISKLLSYEHTQTDHIRQFTETLSIELAEAIGKVLNPRLDALPEQIAQASKPLETTLTNLSHDLTQQMAAAQTEGVGTIVDQFLKEMNGLLDGQIENLSQSIQAICTWQEKTVKSLDGAVSGICKNTDDLAKLNQGLDETVTKLDGLLKEMSEVHQQDLELSAKTTQSLTKAAESVEQTGNEMAEITERSGEIMNRVGKVAASVLAQEEELKKLTGAQLKSLQDGKTLLEGKMKEMTSTGAALTQSFRTSSEQMTKSAENLNQKWADVLSRSFAQFDSELAKALEHFSGTLLELQDVVEAAPALIDDSNTKLRKSSVEYLKTISDYQRQFSQSVEKSVGEMSRQIQRLERGPAAGNPRRG